MQRLSFLALFVLPVLSGLVHAEMPTLQQLANFEYQGIYQQTVKLNEGRYEGAPFVEGGASRPTVTLINTLIAHGDVTGDGHEDVAVLLAENSGGSGTFVYLAVLAKKGDNWVNVATTLLGDRVQLRAMSIAAGAIVIDTAAGQKIRTIYQLGGGELKEQESKTQGVFTVADLDNSSWRLRRLNAEKNLPADSEVTAMFTDSEVSGSAGCNNYQAGIEKNSNNELSIGPVGSTRKLCLGPVMDVEDTFLRQLQAVNQLRFYFGYLVLAYATPDRSGEMLFERAMEK